VNGFQTCALPISIAARRGSAADAPGVPGIREIAPATMVATIAAAVPDPRRRWEGPRRRGALMESLLVVR
jgi:hypothetical protein